jgi:hypothetical protein
LVLFTALRPPLLDGEQDRLRLARLPPQRRTQTQDGADVQMQPGTAPPPLPSIVMPFLILIPTWRCHATVIYFFLSHPQTIYEDRRVLNLIQEPCDSCKEATYDRGRRR